MAVERFDTTLAPIHAIERAVGLIDRAGFPRHEHVHAAFQLLTASMIQTDRARTHRGRLMGMGPFCGCCGQPKPVPVEHIPVDENQTLVTAEDARPAGKPDECFYCEQPIGAVHKPDCVILRKTVRVRMTIDFDHVTVESWRKDDIEFHLNESSFCADNLIAEIMAEKDRQGCLCKIASCEVIGGEGL